MTLVAYTVPLWALAAWRALQGGPLQVRERRYVYPFIAYVIFTIAFAAVAKPSMREALGFAFLFVSAWSDVVARKVYYPVALAALLGSFVTAGLVGSLYDAAIGAAILGGASALLNVLTRGKGWGFGDVLLAAIVGAAFGLHAGLLIFAFGFIVGAVVATMLLATKLIGRRDPLPMVTFVAAGSVVLTMLHVGGLDVA